LSIVELEDRLAEYAEVAGERVVTVQEHVAIPITVELTSNFTEFWGDWIQEGTAVDVAGKSLVGGTIMAVGLPFSIYWGMAADGLVTMYDYTIGIAVAEVRTRLHPLDAASARTTLQTLRGNLAEIKKREAVAD